MDVTQTLKDIPWIKPWRNARECCAGADARRLVRACAVSPPEPCAHLGDVIARSRAFPIPFPIDTVRLEQLQQRRPVERLRSNVASTYPVLHERVLWLIANFLLYKRQHGSSIEKELYKDLGVVEFIDRLLEKRAVTFMKAQDQYKLLSGKTGKEGWEQVGTDLESPPLVLRDCLSYDEMKISALVCVSGHTECINDGARRNAGVVRDDDIEHHAVIIGIVGPRFKRPGRMDCEDILVTAEQNVPAHGYGGGDPARRAYRQLWEDFYQIPSTTYEELSTTQLPGCTSKRALRSRWCARGGGLDNLALQRRLRVCLDTVLGEADARADQAGKMAFVNVVGAGLGIWKHSPHQVEVFVLTLLERVHQLLAAARLHHVAEVNLAYIHPKKEVADLFKSDDSGDDIKKLFLKNDDHPEGGVTVQLWSREPSARLRSARLLVLTYPWDSNAHPGNEFWMGKLSSSGDSAAACSTQVAELHNAHVNRCVCAHNARVAHDGGLSTLREYCERVDAS